VFEREKKFTITIYSDPSHSWGKVRVEVLKNLGIDKAISSYSYRRGNYAYLEEDVDLGILCQALYDNNTRVVFKAKTSNNPSRVRTYDTYAAS
jgi:hypothetical protein